MNNTNTNAANAFNPHHEWNYLRIWRGETFVQVWDQLPGDVQRAVEWCHRNGVKLGIVSESGVPISLDAPRETYYEFSRR